MGLGILVIGKSGSGKSCSMRNFEGNNYGVINVINKPFPFKPKFNGILATDDYQKIISCLQRSEAKTIVIDDAGYLITNQFMRGHSEKKARDAVFGFYNDLADNFWRLTEAIKFLPPEKLCFILMHEEQTENGLIKPKTVGSLLDSKVCIEGLFAIVLRATRKEGQYVFSTQTDGMDVAKSPLGMFEETIENDLVFVEKTIRDYYGLNNKQEEKQ
jgi:hypothetical protein